MEGRFLADWRCSCEVSGWEHKVGSMISWLPVTRDDLMAAAASAGFDTVFPLLVRRLIAETAHDLTSLDMPGGSGTAVGGFDGVVTTSRASGFVPEGTSVWATRAEARRDVFAFLTYYNYDRLHSTLNRCTPYEARLCYRQPIALVA